MPGVARMLCAGQEMIVYGRVKPYGKKLSIVHPDFEIIREGDDQSIHLNRIVPVYSGRMGIAVRRLREIVWEALARLSPAPEPEIYEFVPDIPCKTALRDLHFPETAGSARPDQKAVCAGGVPGAAVERGLQEKAGG